MYRGDTNIEQNMQCTYNVTLRRVDESIVVVEEKEVLHIGVCVCMFARACVRVHGRVGLCLHIRAYSLTNPARNVYAPYCDVICGPSVSGIFFSIIS